MIRIGTRNSRLALVQAEIVKKRILEGLTNEEVKLVPILTGGDVEREAPLDSFGGKGVFTLEIERALSDGDIDLAVHSAKDMPMEAEDGLAIGAALPREDPRDVLVTVAGGKGAGRGSVIGSSSLRRGIQIRQAYPGVEIKPLRGNVPTRIEKLRRGEYDGIILAAAGLIRLGLEKEEDLEYEYLNEEVFLPAAGQGIIAVEARAGSFPEICGRLNDEKAMRALTAERLFLKSMGGSCNSPCGVLYEEDGTGGFSLRGMYAADGAHPRYAAVSSEDVCDESIKSAVTRLAEKLNYGTVSLVGAGCGDAGGITVNGMDRVRRADAVIYDALIPPSLLNEAKLSAELIYVGKRAGRHACSQDEINGLIVKKAKEGKNVVRLKGGDPFVFGRGGEECRALARENISFEVVPGVSSVYGVPAAAGIAVTDRESASGFHVVCGREAGDKNAPAVDYNALAKEEDTLVFLMGLKSIGNIAEKLIGAGKAPNTPAAVISQGGSACQQSVEGRLDEIAHLARGMKPPAVIVIGGAAKKRLPVDTRRNLALTGKRLLFTGTRHMADKLSSAFKPYGGESVAISLTETCDVKDSDADRYLERVNEYSWIAFASSAGVSAFFRRLMELKIDARRLSGVKFAAVGASTGDALARHGYFADFIPSEYTSRNLGSEWTPRLGESDRVLVIRGMQGENHLEDALARRGIGFDRAVLYKTVKDTRRQDEIRRIIPDIDYVVITSGSGAEAFAEICGGKSFDAAVAAIGPETAKVCESLGIPADIVAKRHDAAGLAEAVAQYEKGRKP